MTAPLGLRLIPLGQLGSPNTLGKDIFNRSQGGVYRPVIVPELPPANSVIDGGAVLPTLPAGARSEAQVACEASANAAHALTQALDGMEPGQAGPVFERAANVFKEMWSKGSLLDNPGAPQAAAIAGCYESFNGVASTVLQQLQAQDAPDGALANQLAGAVTWALMTKNGDQVAGLAERLQANGKVANTLTADSKADLAAALELMRQ